MLRVGWVRSIHRVTGRNHGLRLRHPSGRGGRAQLGSGMPHTKKINREKMESSVVAGERRGLWSNLRCSKSLAFQRERRHLVILSVLAGVVFFGCGLLGGTATGRYSPPNTGSFSASAATEPISGSGTDAEREQLDGTGMSLAAAATATPGTSGETPDLKVHLFNTYTKDNPVDLYPWEHLAEPYKPSTMELLGWPEAGDNLEYR